MRPSLALTLFVLGFCQCQQSPQTPAAAYAAEPSTVTLRGYLAMQNNTATLRSCADDKKYQIQDATSTLDSLYDAACFPAPIPGEAVFAVLSGTLAPDGNSFTATRVDTMEGKSPLNACLPWEFWCSGTEPFWSMQISKAEGSIFFKNMGNETGQAFPWKAPETDGKTSWKYETGELHVTIKKSPCTDGMSELTYNYSVEVQCNGDTFRGCAIRSGELMPRER